jgi:diguanylate cyclase (GGDEF)-like protein/PAS domain S-box-containing protein
MSLTPSLEPEYEAEVTALIAVLNEAERRLEVLTAGEVDTISDHGGRTMLLRRAQEHLRRVDANKQSAILDALPANIALLDWHGVVISVNERWREFARSNGLTSANYGLGMNYLLTCEGGAADLQQSDPAAEGLRSVMERRSDSFSMEYPCHSPTEQRWYLMTVTPLLDEARSGVVVMHLDITEKIRGQQALARFGAAMNSTADAITLVSRHSLQFLELNAAACRMFGYTREELLGLGPARLVNLSAEALKCEYDEIIAGRTTDALREEHITWRDGTQLSVEVRRSAQRFGDDWILVSVVRNITARKLAERKLLESERRFSDMLGNVELISVMLDREARITYCNPHLLRFSGWRYEEVIGKDWFALFIPPEMHAMKESHFPNILANVREAMHGETEILLRSGKRRLVHWSRSLLRSEFGDVVGIASIGEDITERKLAEARVVYLNRVHAVLSSINTLIVHVREREALFNETCRIAVREAGFRMAMVGIVDASVGKIFPAAMEAENDGVRDAISRILSSGTLDGETMVARAIRNNEAIVSNDSQIDTQVLSGPLYAESGIRSIAILPLVVAGVSIGALALYAGERDFFQREEMQLLAELAVNIAFSIDNIDRQKKHDRLARTRAVSSDINIAIIHASDRLRLCGEACRIAIDTGGYRMAWIGLVDMAAMKIVPFASSGAEPELFATLQDRFSLDPSLPNSNSMSARAVRERRAVVINDIRNDGSILFSKERIERGICAIAILPLIVHDKVLGVFSWYADEIGFFDTEELALLTEIADNVAFALDHIEKGDRLAYLAYYDALTGLGNRLLCLERITSAMEAAHAGGFQVAMCFIDLERFKNINDSLGEAAGDSLLRQVAQWLTAQSAGTSLPARLGADQFAVVIPNVDPSKNVVHLVSGAMDLFLQHPFHLNDAVFRIAAKVGIALFPQDGADAATLFKHAEAAVKNAKRTGDRFLFYTARMTETVAGRPALENRLRLALEREEFVLHYQPKVDLVTGSITGVEALLRWNDPQSGLIAPANFIPVLEETGLILEVGRWVLRKAIDEYLRWCNAGLLAVPIAVNVSSLQLRDADFFDEIRARIEGDARVAQGLQLEITESLMINDVKQTIASLAALRLLGIKIAMDDFGTGFSSLSYLAKLPFDTLKIDRSFVSQMTVSDEGLGLVTSTINLAHSMRLRVVAEGIETDGQFQQLRSLGCDEIQGFLFCKPIPIDALESRFLSLAARSLGHFE